MDNPNFQFKSSVVLVPLFSVLSIWIVYFIEIQFKLNFNSFGIYPHTIRGLRGIIFSPFIHGSLKHLFNNTIPLAVLLACLYFFYQKIATKVLLLGILLSGMATWLIGRPSYHIGASGIIYLLVSFVFFSGVFRKYYRLIAVSLIVVFLYGSLVWYIFPTEESISWEGHLSGFLIGLLFAFIFKNVGPQNETYIFQKNEEFEKMFDENGNFILPVVPEDTDTDMHSENTK